MRLSHPPSLGRLAILVVTPLVFGCHADRGHPAPPWMNSPGATSAQPYPGSAPATSPGPTTQGTSQPPSGFGQGQVSPGTGGAGSMPPGAAPQGAAPQGSTTRQGMPQQGAGANDPASSSPVPGAGGRPGGMP